MFSSSEFLFLLQAKKIVNAFLIQKKNAFSQNLFNPLHAKYWWTIVYKYIVMHQYYNVMNYKGARVTSLYKWGVEVSGTGKEFCKETTDKMKYSSIG